MDDGTIPRIDFDVNHSLTEITKGGQEKAIEEALDEAQSMFDMEEIDGDIWSYLSRQSAK